MGAPDVSDVATSETIGLVVVASAGVLIAAIGLLVYWLRSRQSPRPPP